jgi:ATP/maltotriose-dependent transcriptional regulator MalT
MIEENLLQTKLFTPPLRRNLVSRSRLIAKLNDGLSPEIRLILVSAPAGFGKTTLVSEWLKELSLLINKEIPAYTWLTLDEDDNDPIRFWRYIDAAFQRIDPRIGRRIRSALSAPQPAPYRALVTGIIDDILEVQASFILVLDDYHNIKDETVQSGLNYFLDHLPPAVKLLIITRADPPLQLARRRSHSEICEVRASDLRFTLDEVLQLLKTNMNLDLSGEDIATIEKHTEGWIAGLQMAAISMQDAADPHDFVIAFQGNDRYIADYLVEEVLQRQPVEFQQFLLQTSILNQLSGPLCDAVTGRSDSQLVLNNLERANLFIIPLDNRREWFRYHQLFANLLYQRLVDSKGADTVKLLKQRAGEWYASHRRTADAVDIFLACGDYVKAVDLIEAGADHLFMSNELNLLVKWISMVPDELVANRPRLNMMAAWGAQATGNPQVAEHLINLFEKTVGLTAEEFLRTPPPSQVLSPLQKSTMIEAIVLRSRLAIDTLALETSFSLGERVLPYLVPGPIDEPRAFNFPYMYHGPQLLILGQVHKLRGNLKKASDLMIQAEQDAERLHNPHIIALALGYLGEIESFQGHLVTAKEYFARALRSAQEFPQFSSAFWGISEVGLANVSFEQNHLIEAEYHLKTGLELGKLWHVWECLLPGCICQARIHQVYGEWGQATSALDELIDLAALNIHAVETAVAANKALLAFRQGDLVMASHWANTFDINSMLPYPLQWELNALIAGRIWLAEKKFTKANILFDKLLEQAQASGNIRICMEIHLLQALLALEQNQVDLARQSLLKSLNLAAPEGFVRLFLDEGEPIRSFIKECLPSISEPGLLEFAEHLLKSFVWGIETRPVPVSKAPTPDQTKLIEALSARELEVIRLMAEGLSNPAIAKRLFLSSNTLKAHTQNIYQKLDVHNRMEAVNKARELGLLNAA